MGFKGRLDSWEQAACSRTHLQITEGCNRECDSYSITQHKTRIGDNCRFVLEHAACSHEYSLPSKPIKIYLKYHVTLHILVTWGRLIPFVECFECNANCVHFLLNAILPQRIAIDLIEIDCSGNSFWHFKAGFEALL